MNSDNNKNIVSLELNKIIPDSAIGLIMLYHGGVYSFLPDEVRNSSYTNNIDKLLKYIRRDNFQIIKEGHPYCKRKECYLVVNVNKHMIEHVMNDDLFIHYSYPTKFGSMSGRKKISYFDNDVLKMNDEKYHLKFDKFQYIQLREMYKKVDDDYWD